MLGGGGGMQPFQRSSSLCFSSWGNPILLYTQTSSCSCKIKTDQKLQMTICSSMLLLESRVIGIQLSSLAIQYVEEPAVMVHWSRGWYELVILGRTEMAGTC